MKRKISLLISALLVLSLLLGACADNTPLCAHTDGNDDGICDGCAVSVLVVVDFYAVNDLHGKLDDTDSQPGVDELSTYLEKARKTDDYAIFLSSGDMWQGSAESNMTHGLIVTDWMNELDFVSMTLGNHEFWGRTFEETLQKLKEQTVADKNIRVHQREQH